MYKLKRIENQFEDIAALKAFLKSKIFVSQNKESYVFEDNDYAVMNGDFGLLIPRNKILWKNINPKHKYSIFQYESNFILRTDGCEINTKENEFIISIISNEDGTYIVTFLSLEEKNVRLRLLSD